MAPELAEPDSVSFASGAGEAVLLTSTGDDDVIDAQATIHLPSTGMQQNLNSPFIVTQLARRNISDHVQVLHSFCAEHASAV